MKPIISEELYAFLGMTLSGGAIGILFDFFRCFRKKVIKKVFWVHITDILFWVASLIFSLKMIYYFNDGILRACFALAAFLGLILYFLTFSRLIRGVFSIILQIIFKIFKIIFKILLTPTHFLYKILLVAFEGIIRVMKNRKRFKSKKVKKRGCRNDKKKIENISAHGNGFFGDCLFIDKGSYIATGNKPE